MKNFPNINMRRKSLLFGVILVVAMFIMVPFSASIGSSGGVSDLSIPTSLNSQSVAVPAATGNALTASDYTNGTYIMGGVGALGTLNPAIGTTVNDFLVADEIYQSPMAYLDNGTYAPWMITGYQEYNVSNKHITTFDPESGTMQNVKYIYTVHIRPNDKWDDWTSSNAADTYTYSNYTSFINCAGVAYSHTFKSFYNTSSGTNQTWTPVTMLTYEVQAADFIISWQIQNGTAAGEGGYPGVVNIVPVNNLTVEYYLSSQNTLFYQNTLGEKILPYHIWKSHDYASVSGLWNYTASLNPLNAYNAWNMGLDSTTGYASGLVGNGPFMMIGGNGVPKGAWLLNDYWKLYINPNYFTQYNSSLAKYTPKIYSLETICYTSESTAVSALASGQVDALYGVDTSFIPTIKAIPSTYVYYKPSTGFANLQINAYKGNAPFNITTLREALQYAVPKTYIAQDIDQGYDVPQAPTVVTSTNFLWHDSNVPFYHFNLQKARSTINATINATKSLPSAYQLHYNSKDGYYAPGATLYYGSKPVTITMQVFLASESPEGVAVASKVAEEWDSLGIHTTVKQEEQLTACAATVALSPSDQTAFNVIQCGVSTLAQGNDAGVLKLFYNSASIGSGFYLGTFTSLTYNGPNVTSMGLIHGKFYTGSQVISLMDNMTNYMFTTSNLSLLHQISNGVQYLAAQEATFINEGSGVDAIPITNSTFTGIIKSDTGLSTFWYWNFMNIHLKKAVAQKLPTSIPTELMVGAITNQKLYFDGQYGNLTVQVRNQYGAPVSDMTVTIGVTPVSSLLSIGNTTGTTNGNGIYTYEFQANPSNTLLYTSNGAGNITFTITAYSTSSNVISGTYKTYIDLSPYSVTYKTDGSNLLMDNSKMEYYNITVCNPLTGKPLSGYEYTIQTLTGAVLMKNTSSSQVLVYTKDIDFFGIPFLGVGTGITVNATTNISTTHYDYNMTSISGTTGSNGLISVMIGANPDYNFSLLGDYSTSYIFVGSYSSAAPVAGEADFQQLGEVSSSYSYVGAGYSEPFEIPVMLTNNLAKGVNIDISTDHSVTYNGTTDITAHVTGVEGNGIANYTLTFTAQNAMGENRGYFVGGAGNGYNPNCYIYSTNMPEITVMTNATGYATVVFDSGMWKEVTSTTGNVIGFAPSGTFSSTYVPYDEFEIAVAGSTDSNSTYVVSSPYTFNSTLHPFLKPVVSVYLNNSQVLDNTTLITGNATYTMYINTTYNSAGGPSASNIMVNVTVSIGTVSISSVNTSTSGSYIIKYNAPNVTVLTAVKITVTASDPYSHTYTMFIEPAPAVTKVVKPNYEGYYAVIGVLVVIAVIMGILYVDTRRKIKK